MDRLYHLATQGRQNHGMEQIIIGSKNQWRSRGESVEIDGRRFLLHFDSELEKIRVLHKQLWVILGQTMLMLEITESNYMQDSELIFSLFGRLFQGS